MSLSGAVRFPGDFLGTYFRLISEETILMGDRTSLSTQLRYSSSATSPSYNTHLAYRNSTRLQEEGFVKYEENTRRTYGD